MVKRIAFLANPKHQYHLSHCEEHDYSGHKKKNVDYYEYPCLTHFRFEHELYVKWWKEKLFLQI